MSSPMIRAVVAIRDGADVHGACAAWARGVVASGQARGVALDLDPPVAEGLEPGGDPVPVDGVGILRLDAPTGASPEELSAELSAVGLLARQLQEAREERHARRRRMIHDLRGLLGVVLGHCELMEAGVGGPLSPRQQRSVDAIRRQVERCGEKLAEYRERPA